MTAMVIREKKMRNIGVGRRQFLAKIGPGLLSVIGLVHSKEESDEGSERPTVGVHPQAVSRKKRG
mgnify:CR=1 FL=1